MTSPTEFVSVYVPVDNEVLYLVSTMYLRVIAV